MTIMNNNIITEIKGKKYVSIEYYKCPIKVATKASEDALLFEGICVYLKVNYGLLFYTVDMQLLIPENNINEFMAIDDKKRVQYKINKNM